MAKKDKEEDSQKKQQASLFLKHADKYFKSGDFEAALKEVENALEVDPGNFYARAYKDRIEAARSASQERVPQSEDSKQNTEVFKKKLLQEQQRAEQERKRQEAERQRAEQELRRRALEIEAAQLREHEEHKRILELRRQEEEDLKRKEEERRKQLEEELAKKRAEEERKRQEIEQQKRKEEEEKRRKLEEELTRKRIEEEKKRIEEEEKKRKAEEERKRIEAEERRKAEEARKKLEEEIKRRLEEERARKQEEEYLRKASEEGRREAVSNKIQEYLTSAGQYLQERNYDNALLEALRVITLDPENSYAKQIEELVKNAWVQEQNEKISSEINPPHEKYLEIYKKLLTLAWSEGSLDEELTGILEDARTKLNISFDEYIQLERTTQVDAYQNSLRKAWADGTLTPEEGDHLQILRNDLKISAEDHFNIEQSVRKELGF